MYNISKGSMQCQMVRAPLVLSDTGIRHLDGRAMVVVSLVQDVHQDRGQDWQVQGRRDLGEGMFPSPSRTFSDDTPVHPTRSASSSP